VAPAQDLDWSRSEAKAFYRAQRWLEAEGAWRLITERFPADQGAWLRLGATLCRMGQPENALDALEGAVLADGTPMPEAMFWTGVCNVMLHRAPEAIEALEAAAEEGWWDRELASKLPALDPLRRSPRFEALRSTAKERAAEAV